MVLCPPVEHDAAALSFRVRDYEGVEVICVREHWASKIEGDHPELRDREREAAAVIERPSLVLRDRDYPDRKHHIARTRDGRYLKVVVAYRSDPAGGEPVGNVVTAFPMRRFRSGDAILYAPERGAT